MKVIVHIKQAVEVEVPDALVPMRRDRWGNNAMQRYAVDEALAQVAATGWVEDKTWSGTQYCRHPSLQWIEYPKKEMTSGVL